MTAEATPQIILPRFKQYVESRINVVREKREDLANRQRIRREEYSFLLRSPLIKILRNAADIIEETRNFRTELNVEFSDPLFSIANPWPDTDEGMRLPPVDLIFAWGIHTEAYSKFTEPIHYKAVIATVDRDDCNYSVMYPKIHSKDSAITCLDDAQLITVVDEALLNPQQLTSSRIRDKYTINDPRNKMNREQLLV